MATERTWDPQQKKFINRETKSKGDVDSAVDKAKLTTVAGTGLGSKGSSGRTPMPKQSDYSSMAAYSSALARWRADDTAARKQAMK